MPSINQLTEQHIERYQSHLKHIDKLLERSQKGAASHPDQADIQAQLAKLKAERDKFAQHVDTLKLGSAAEMQEEMIEEAGPMGVWDALAQQLEKLVERIES
jgi:cell division protein FtsB